MVPSTVQYFKSGGVRGSGIKEAQQVGSSPHEFEHGVDMRLGI